MVSQIGLGLGIVPFELQFHHTTGYQYETGGGGGARKQFYRSDDLIAGVLNRNGHKTGHGNRWTRERVTALRSHHHIARYDAARKEAEGWMNLTEAAAFVGIAPRTLRLAVEDGKLCAEHPLADGPWIFQRAELTSAAARSLIAGLQRPTRGTAVPNENQSQFDFSST